MAALLTGDFRTQDIRSQQVVEETLKEFTELQTYRMNFGMQWEEVASLVMPQQRNTFVYGNYNFPGIKKTELQIDATGMMALTRFSAICDSLLTPRNLMWHQLTPSDKYLLKDRQSRLWFEDATRALFKYRYAPDANFASQNQQNYTQLGAYGNMTMFVDALYSLRGERGLRYRSVPVGEMYLKENHQGQIDSFIRWFRLTAEQAYKAWNAKGTFPEALRPALEAHSQTPYDFLHRVCPRDDYNPQRKIEGKDKPWASYYVCMASKTLLEESGYYTFPAPTSRYLQAPGEVYGRGPAMLVLPALKTLNAEKRVFLKAGHRAADPVLLTADDGLVDFSMRPGALNKGGWSSDGHPLVGILPTGNIQISQEMMQEEKSLINDAFLVSLFQILEETPQMSATEVVERVNEKGILIAPTMGRQQSEYLGPLIDRELDLLQQLRLLPPMPPLLKEAKGAYHVEYTSPLAKSMQSQEVLGFFRTVNQASQIVTITQDTSIMDVFDFDTALPEIADQQGTPTRWMASDDKVSAKRQARAQAQQQQAQIQAAPAAAAMMKAKTNAASSGVTPDQLQQFSQQQGPPQAPQQGTPPPMPNGPQQ